MSDSITHEQLDRESHTLEIAPNRVVPSDVMRAGSQTIMLIVGLFLGGALAVAGLVLGSELLAVGAFVAFSMMMMIGMPLILASVGDALDTTSHE